MCLCVCVCAPYRAAPAPPSSSAASPASLKVCDPLAALSVASASLSPEVPFIRPLDPPRAELTSQPSTALHHPSHGANELQEAVKGFASREAEVEAGAEAEEEVQTEAAFNMFVF